MTPVRHYLTKLGTLGKGFINAIKRFGEDDMLTYAAAIAYQMVFSLFPFLIFLSALLGILQIPGFFEQLINEARNELPGQAIDILEQVVAQIRETKSVGLLLFGVIATLWAASAGVRALMHALNSAYHVEQERATLKRYPLSIVYTILLAVLLMAAVGLMLLSSPHISWIADQLDLGVSTIFLVLWTWLRFPVAVLLLMVTVEFIYYVLPNAHEPLRFITIGAVLAVIVWVAGTLGFSYFVSNFVVYNATYGSLGTFMALQLYSFISASILLLGAEVNVEIYYHPDEGQKEGEKR